MIDFASIQAAVENHFSLSLTGIHGVSHWTRVGLNGTRLSIVTGADLDIVRLFALLHDSCRMNEGHDRDHGRRAAKYAERWRSVLDPDRFDLLYYALEYHNDGLVSEDATIGTCWDADRLDLRRLGITPDPEILSTEAARLQVTTTTT